MRENHGIDISFMQRRIVTFKCSMFIVAFGEHSYHNK